MQATIAGAEPATEISREPDEPETEFIEAEAALPVPRAKAAPATCFDTACRFLDTLVGPGQAVTFQTFDDSKEKRKDLVRVLHGTIEQHFEALEALNAQGAGVFVSANQTDGRGRCAANITALRSLFVDADGIPLPEFALEPNIIVRRDAAHWHAYWLLRPGEPLAEWSAAQKRLAAYYGTDAKIHDLPRVMRIPGFLHRKSAAVELATIRNKPTPRRTIAEILDAHPEPAPEPVRTAPPRRTAAPLPGDNPERTFRAWAARKGADATNGNRNSCLFEMAAFGAGRGVSEGTVLEVCTSYANGLGEREIEGIIKSAFSKERTANPPPPLRISAPAPAAVTPEALEPPHLQAPHRVSDLLAYNTDHDAECLLGRRWVCRGGSCLWVGQSGVGKSSLAVQAAVTWGLGLPLFGIRPVRPLKSVIIQSENDRGDVAEQLRGVLNGLDLAGRAAELEDRLILFEENAKTGRDFVSFLGRVVREHSPDLLWIDPLLAYLGASVSDQAIVSAFLRTWLSPVLKATGAAAMVVHHTGKPPRDPAARNGFLGQDYSYLGIGSSELTNWTRAVVSLREVEEGLYEFRASKRGARAGLMEHDGDDASEANPIYLKHGEHGICWMRAAGPGADQEQYIQDTVNEVLGALDSAKFYTAVGLREMVEKSTGKKRSTVLRQGSIENRIYNSLKEKCRVSQQPNLYQVQGPTSSNLVQLDPEVQQSNRPLRGGGLDVGRGGTAGPVQQLLEPDPPPEDVA